MLGIGSYIAEQFAYDLQAEMSAFLIEIFLFKILSTII
jgi:hypothetical protein